MRDLRLIVVTLSLLIPSAIRAADVPQYTISTLATSTATVGIDLQNGIAVDASDNVYVPGGVPESVVLKANASATTVVVGSTQSNAPFPGCGMSALAIGMTDLGGLAMDASGNLYVAQSGNGPVLRVSGGTVMCLDAARYFGAVGIAADNLGNAWISLGTNGNVVYKLPASGGAVIVAGTGAFGCSGGALSDPEGLALDNAGNLYIADHNCNVIWKLTPAGTLTMVAGNGIPGFSGDGGPATSASLNQPQSVAVDVNGNLYIADWANSRVRLVKNGIIYTIAGNGLPGYTGDGGPATSAELAGPWGIAVAGGKVYFTDQGKFNAVIRQLIPTVSKAGIFRSGFFWLEDVDGNQQFNSPPDRAFPFGGVPGDMPITGDWSGSGTTKVGVYRSSNGLFILDYNGDGVFEPAVDKVYSLGVGTQPGDVPVVGDWNGDGRSKVGIFRQGFFWILDTNGDGVFSAGDQAFAFGGIGGDVPVVGDWTGTGTSNVGVFRAGYLWVLDTTGTHTVGQAFPFGGIPGDVPVVGDWNGDGKTKVGIFRDGFLWILDTNGSQSFIPGVTEVFAFGGISGDKPVVGKW